MPTSPMPFRGVVRCAVVRVGVVKAAERTISSSTPSTRFASVRLISARSATVLASCVWVSGNGTPRSNDADAQGAIEQLNLLWRIKPAARPDARAGAAPVAGDQAGGGHVERRRP